MKYERELNSPEFAEFEVRHARVRRFRTVHFASPTGTFNREDANCRIRDTLHLQSGARASPSWQPPNNGFRRDDTEAFIRPM